ncbi:MAG: hypothetical protein V4683_14325 [Bacteroidota bacterium]
MKKLTTIILLLTTATFLFIYIGCDNKKTSTTGNVSLFAALPSRLPANALQSCTITQPDFNSWFASGTATENGIVMPANSVTFGHHNNCDFYKWSWQMFAWITSPLADKKTVMESPIFYTVSPADTAGNRTLLPHTPGVPLQVTSSITQFGANNLPTIKDKLGHIFEIEKHPANSKPLVLMGNRKTIIHHVDLDESGKPIFKDQSGKIIQNPKAVFTRKGNFVHEFKASNGKSVFVSANGPIETEEGQAQGSHGLMAQNGSLVYYITMINDVFAFYLSGAKNGEISSAQFPTTAAQRDSISEIARANGKTLPDSNALAMEIKTSWVEASSLPDPQNYVTIEAVVPSYTKTDSLWTPNATTQTVKLAMVGMHVVGSTAGHPEMVWATFEQKNNAPNASYQYLNTDSTVVVVPQDSIGSWTFSSNGLDPNPNLAHFTAAVNTLIAEKGSTISASNSLMAFPWGSAANISPNAENGSSAASNSEVISINNSVLGWLVGNDIRKNYVLIGATWTNSGVAPTGTSFSTNPSDPGAAIGTSLLANITMETYKQSNQNSCFTCHSNNPNTASLSPAVLSHVYTGIIPLFKSKAAK